VESCRTRYGGFSRSEEPYLDRILGQTPLVWQDHRIIPDNDRSRDKDMNPVENKSWRYKPHLIVFFSSAFIMIIEIIAGRLVARHIGTSLYTWTSVIGVILAGMSAGNYVGGRVADHWKPAALIEPLFLLSSAVCLSVLLINKLFSDFQMLNGMLWPMRAFLTVLTIFFLPAVALGTISPTAAKMALEQGDSMGKTIGSVYAWGAVGSVIGTFLTGFWLIAALGTKGVVLAISFALAIMALSAGRFRWGTAIWAGLLGALLAISQLPTGYAEILQLPTKFFGLRENPSSLFAADSRYQFIEVIERTSDYDRNRRIRSLALDHSIHGYVDLDDLSYLDFHYQQIFDHIAVRIAGNKPTVSALILGGGSYSFPRWIIHEWPGSKVDVVEIDPMVVKVNHLVLGLSYDTSIRTFVGDARNVVDDLKADDRYDLVVGDAFDDLSIPFQLTTLEFNEKIARHILPGGVYMINVVDDWRFARFLGAYFSTLKKTFKHVHIFCTHRDGVVKNRDNFVIAASMTSIFTDDWLPAHDGNFPGSMLTCANLTELVIKSARRILTDDNAPVEYLLEPVARTSEP
jgi:spermidine synthase